MTAAQLEKETGMKMVITLHEHRLAVDRGVYDGVSLGHGVYSHETVANAVLHSLEYEAIKTPILPRNAIPSRKVREDDLSF